MARLLLLATRGLAAFAASVMMLAGLVFAMGGESDSTILPAAALRVIDLQPTSTPIAPAPSVITNTPAEPTEATASQAPEPTEAPAPATRAPAVALPVAAPNRPPPPPAPPTSAPPRVTDLPKYTDVAVLALAANAIVPSGLTFRECVERPPSTEKWPSPVHLYYLGRGRWLVETHVSEVQVVFDEATGTFTPGNFAPTNPGCR